ncbi:hypothetical protein IRT45_30780 [Nocardia sp. BSTN01]|uniref:WXG100-like domain-containing protein n=1 Tax=Nocardia sp. BSTN01 TaxID=2783665 RepID=UPI00188F788F|nr:hypothetical protein [Nocardia sp. BSTN01]MBF5001519.1 hypothetical protein [Nocardia sp. BSTN01]
MAIEIPHKVALFLNFAGVPYPDINEDQVRALGKHVRTFANSVADTHASATGVIKDMGNVYSGYSYRALVAAWAQMSKSHMADLDAACRVVADALDAAAVVIRVTKIAVLAELAGLAASFAAATAGSIVTGGLSAAIEQAIVTAARKICEVMEQALIAYILFEVIEKAMEPLRDVIDRIVRGIVDEAAGHLLEPPPGQAEHVLYIEPDEVINHAQTLEMLADDMLQHASNFAKKVAALDFTSRAFDDSADVGPAVLDPSGHATSQQIPHSRPTALTSSALHTAPPNALNTDSNASESPRDHVGAGTAHRETDASQSQVHHPRAVAPTARSEVPSNGNFDDVRPNSATTGDTSDRRIGPATANPGGASSSGDVVASAESIGQVMANPPDTTQPGHGDTSARNAEQWPMADLRAASTTDQLGGLPWSTGQDRPGGPAGEPGSVEGHPARAELKPGVSPERKSGQSITPWRRRTSRHRTRAESVRKAKPSGPTPWTGGGTSPRTEPATVSRQDGRSTPRPAEESAKAPKNGVGANAPDADPILEESLGQAGAVQAPKSAHQERPTVVAPSISGDKRPELSLENLPGL